MNTYPHYKPSGIDWIREIPEHWERVCLKRIVEIKVTDGPHETPVFVEEGVPFISAESIKSNSVDFNYKRGYISKELDIEYSKKCKPQKHDIFIVKSGSTTGKVAYVDFDDDFNIWSPLALVRCCPKIALSKFTFYALQSEYFQKEIQLNWSFGTQPNIGMNVIENLKFVLPPLSEQTAIANYLDRKTAEIDQTIADKEALIGLYEEEKKGLINEAVTKGLNPNVPFKPSDIEWLGDVPEHWEVKKLKYVANLRSGDTITSELIAEEGAYPVYGGNGLRGYTTDYTHEGNYVLIGRQGALCGNINYAFGKFWASEHAIVATILDNSEFVWLGEFLKMMNLNQYSLASAQPGLSVDRIQNLHIPYPPLPEQAAIVDYIETETAKINEKMTVARQEIGLLKEFRQALIFECVTGKVCYLEEKIDL